VEVVGSSAITSTKPKALVRGYFVGMLPTRLVTLGRVDDGVAQPLTGLTEHSDVPIGHEQKHSLGGTGPPDADVAKAAVTQRHLPGAGDAGDVSRDVVHLFPLSLGTVQDGGLGPSRSALVNLKLRDKPWTETWWATSHLTGGPRSRPRALERGRRPRSPACERGGWYPPLPGAPV
jgi:hypothetical protein